ncbi:MAG: GspE/PulE family protein [Thermodesulfovibrionales bacterium]|nr:GspE/PulE family protein [Thermodesulfovibrionales bacterium]
MLIGEILLNLFGVKAEDINKALDIQKEVGGYIGQILIQTGTITETQLLQALSAQLKLPVLNSENSNSSTEDILSFVEDKLDINFVVENGFVPIGIDHQSRILSFVTNDPLKNPIINYVAKSMDYDIHLILAPEKTIKDLSKKYILDSMDGVVSLGVEESVERLKDMAFEAPVIKYLNSMLSRAVELTASDVHIEPSENRYRVRFRIDGVLHDIDSLKEEFYLALVSRIKLLSGLDIAERRLPQDGKFTTKIGSTFLDLRISTIPILKGEDVVIRLLYRGRLSFDLRHLGQMDDHYTIIRNMISKPYGMILVTGPTGSGKTTTLYSMLTYLNNDEKKIVTIEDPVEYQLGGLNQLQVKSDVGLTFASALRSILRHDPDIIMVGEIRDKETARISIQSALTGHLVLSTLHTNDAASSLFRLLDMGIEDYLINASVIGIIAQRIIRLNCPHCSTEDYLSEDIIKQYRIYEIHDKYRALIGNINFRRGKGCSKCVGTGYRGRTAIFELFEYEEDLKKIFIRMHSLEAIRDSIVSYPYFRTLRDDGILKVIDGRTTIEEVLRVT